MMTIIVLVRTRTIIVPVFITSPIQSIQEPTISNHVIAIQNFPTMRSIVICLISSVLLSIAEMVPVSTILKNFEGILH